jgi:hypothetical protein
MATLSKETPTPGSILASERFDAAIADGLAERPARYPFGAAFLGADMPGLGEVLARHAREGRAVVLVYADGVERVLESHPPLEAKAA